MAKAKNCTMILFQQFQTIQEKILNNFVLLQFR